MEADLHSPPVFLSSYTKLLLAAVDCWRVLTRHAGVSALVKLSHERVPLLYARPVSEQLHGTSLVTR